MGLGAELIRTVRTYMQRRNGSPGENIIIEGTGLGGVPLNAEVYQLPGVRSRPTKSTRGVFIPLGGSRRHGVVIAFENYGVNIAVDEGGVAVYSTNAAGDTIEGKIEIDPVGKIKIANRIYNLKTIIDARHDALKTFATTASSATTAAQIAAAATTLFTALNLPNCDSGTLLK